MRSISKIRFFRQHTQYSCGPASLKMVFDFFGIHKKESELIKECKTNKVIGTKHLELIKSARKNNLYCYVHDGSSLKQIQHFIDLDMPVIVSYIEPSEDEGHYAVVTGYNKSSIFINDPWNGKNFKLSQKEFLKRWMDKYGPNKSKKWILVLSKIDFNIGRVYTPIRKRQ